ncbi:TetR/AcrR family transcriptional regulator [Streptomyces pactum]|uniref:TetR/AcrR family transcriptional regulator n=2 Tax=Streptomyces pactum TaxID=68249 RepID=A0ABS0NT77_9ACTN|nr:TetR/AcrR family transcriptional regulator [Streptomyces pactum]
MGTRDDDGRGRAARRERTDARRNRERLLAAAREVFAEEGPEASLNAIARRAGVGPGTLYRHFPNRQALLAAVLRDRVERLCGRAGELAAGQPPDAALAHWLALFLEHARDHQGMGGALLVQDARALGIDCHRMIHDAAAGLLDRARRRGTARADLAPDDLLRLVVGIALSTARDADEGQSARLLDLVLDAVFRPAPGDRRARSGGAGGSAAGGGECRRGEGCGRGERGPAGEGRAGGGWSVSRRKATAQ